MNYNFRPCPLACSLPFENSIFSNSSFRPFKGKNACEILIMKWRNLLRVKVCPCSEDYGILINLGSEWTETSQILLKRPKFPDCRICERLKSRMNFCRFLRDSCSLSNVGTILEVTNSFIQYNGYTLANWGARITIVLRSFSHNRPFDI
jgi:hypothetical protein